jgi:asparagine synthase (glutamine-hydrolysing)
LHKTFASNGLNALDHLNKQLYRSSFETILPTLLRNYDRYSMINGVEIRMPFLDHRIVSFAFSIPGSSKVRKGYTKAIVRDAMKGFFPDDIRLLKRKIGFHSPITEWMKGPLKEWLSDQMECADFKNAALIDAKAVKTKVQSVMESPNATFLDGEEAWKSLMPFIWEKSLQYAR